jgi:zinc transport system substrate-binding protein
MLVAAVLALLAPACGGDTPSDDGRLRVVTGAYPLAEVAERVGGDLVHVENLTPPGVEPHDLELTTDDLEALLTADIVLFVGAGFQPAVQDAVAEAEGAVVDVLHGVDTLSADRAVDPHVWLDPARFRLVVGPSPTRWPNATPTTPTDTVRTRSGTWGSSRRSTRRSGRVWPRARAGRSS